MAIDRFSTNRRRLTTAAALLLLRPDVVWAREDATTFARLSSLVRPARQHLQKKQLLAALTLLEQANQMIEEQAEERWPFRAYVLPAYGYALLEIGRNQEAVTMLEQALQASDRINAEELQQFQRVLSNLDDGIGKATIKAEFLRQLLSGIRIGVGRLPHVQQTLFDTTVGSADLVFTLGRALAATGNDATLASLYESRIASVPIPSENSPAFIAQQYRFFKFGVLLFQMERHDLAIHALEKASRMNTERFQTVARGGTPVELVWSSFALQRATGSALVDVCQAAGCLEQRTESLLVSLLQAKGGSLRYIERVKQLLDRSSDDTVIQLRERANAFEDQIALLPPTNEAVQSLMALAAQHGACMIEAVRALRAPEELSFASLNPLSLPDLRTRLNNSAVMGFVVYSPLPQEAFIPGANRYLRYCITREELQLIDVGAQRDIDQAVHAFRMDIHRVKPDAQGGNALAQRLLHELPRSVRSAGEWIIDPDAGLCLLPFEALPDVDGRPLLHARAMRYVTSVSQLMRTEPAPTDLMQACIIANPLFGSKSDRQQTENSSSDEKRTAFPVRGTHIEVSPLPDTAREAQSVADALTEIGIPTTRYEGAQARAESLRSNASPAVLHIATHAVLLHSSQREVPSEDPNQVVDMLLPGRRSGIVLSRSGAPDLILAKDIARLPLQGTKLVVLSACNTGNGDIVPGEGIASLRRAVEIAGARGSVTSLWAVPSKATTELMTSFYRLMGKGLPAAEALRQAKLVQAKLGRPAFEWAPFLFCGRDVVLVHSA